MLFMATDKRVLRRLMNLKRAARQIKGDHYFWLKTQTAVNIWPPKAILEAVWPVATQEGRRPLFERQA